MVHTEFFWVLALVRKGYLEQEPWNEEDILYFCYAFPASYVTHMLFLETNCVTQRFWIKFTLTNMLTSKQKLPFQAFLLLEQRPVVN